MEETESVQINAPHRIDFDDVGFGKLFPCLVISF